MLPVNFRHFVIACALALIACTANATYTLGSRNASHTYDSATNRLQSINTNGVYTGFSYDALGRRVFSAGLGSSINNRTSVYTHTDGLGLLARLNTGFV